MKYIDADRLQAEIEKLYNGEVPPHDPQCDYGDGYFTGIGAISQFIDSLQQEQPKVDLEKEIDEIWKTCNPVDEGMGVETANIHIEQFDYLARHFAQWGAEHLATPAK